MTPPLQANPIQLVSNAASGGTWASGTGMNDASGLVEKEWAEFRQWLTIEYTRNPVDTNRRNPEVMRNLSMVSSVDIHDLRYSELHYRITAHSSCSIISGTYSSSGFHQLQKFTITPNKYDKMDSSLTYGDVSGTGIVFGPQGRIDTSQPFIRRREKAVGDYDYTHTYMGTNHGFLASGGDVEEEWGYGADIGQDYGKYLWKYQDANEPWANVDFPHAHNKAWGIDRFMMNGAYAVSSEPGYGSQSQGMQVLEGVIEAVAASLRNPNFFYRLCLPEVTASDGYSSPREADRLPVMSTYDSSRHDFT